MPITINNSALLLIEFQYEWLHEKGKLYPLMTDKTSFLASIEKAKKIIATARFHNMPVIHSGLSFQTDYPELGNAQYGLRYAIKANQTFSALTEGSLFLEPFIPQEGEFIVQGRVGSSAFAGSNLNTYLRNNRIETIYLMGYALHVCVESTLRAAHDLGYEVILIEDASAAFTKEQTKHVLDNIVHHFGAHIPADDFISALQQEEKQK